MHLVRVAVFDEDLLLTARESVSMRRSRKLWGQPYVVACQRGEEQDGGDVFEAVNPVRQIVSIKRTLSGASEHTTSSARFAVRQRRISCRRGAGQLDSSQEGGRDAPVLHVSVFERGLADARRFLPTPQDVLVRWLVARVC